jgi:very-short-patch-repair endonuclease
LIFAFPPDQVQHVSTGHGWRLVGSKFRSGGTSTVIKKASQKEWVESTFFRALLRVDVLPLVQSTAEERNPQSDPVPNSDSFPPATEKTVTKKSTISQSEQMVLELLQTKGLVFRHDKRGLIPSHPDLRVDFYLPDLNLVIELDDPSHFSATKHSDTAKDAYCYNQRIHLARIPTCTKVHKEAVKAQVEIALVHATSKERLLSAVGTDYYKTKVALPSVSFPPNGMTVAV